MSTPTKKFIPRLRGSSGSSPYRTEREAIQGFGKKITRLRTMAKLSQAQLAKRVGVTRITVSRWEHAKNWPNHMVTIRLLEFFDVTYRYLIGGINYQSHENIDVEEGVILLEKVVRTMSQHLQAMRLRRQRVLESAELLDEGIKRIEETLREVVPGLNFEISTPDDYSKAREAAAKIQTERESAIISENPNG